MLPNLSSEVEAPADRISNGGEDLLIFVVYLLPFIIEEDKGVYKVNKSRVIFMQPTIRGYFTLLYFIWLKLKSSKSNGLVS